MAHDGDEDFFYQPQRGRGQRLDPAIARMVLAAGGVGLTIIIVAFIWSGFHAGNFGPPPVINPPATPLRVIPASPGGLVVPGANVPIMSGDPQIVGVPKLAPSGQMPDVAQLDKVAGLLTPPVPPSAATPAPAAGAAPANPASALPLPPAPPPAVPPAPSLAAKPGPAQVQLAATADEGGAEAAWLAAERKAPDVLAGKTAIILPAVINGQSIWRVRLSGFASPAAAQAFCDKLTAKGADCMVPGS